jgi:hypothetical protein
MMLWFFLWILWFMLLFRIIADLFSDHSLSGWGKAGWLIFVILLPFLGVFVYLIVRGRSMSERAARQAADSEVAFKKYVKEAAGSSGGGNADELSKLAALKADGTLSDAEFERAKAKILA